MRAFTTVIILLLTVSISWGQASDSAQTLSDSLFINRKGKVVSIRSYASKFNPRKALLYSAVFPGAGQAYNKKYWKLPIVYGGFAALGIVAKSFNDQHKEYREDLFAFLSENPRPTRSQLGLTEEQLRSIIDRSRRERDYFIILSGFWYILQLVDAHVDAHLKEFDVNPNLRVRLEPSIQQNNLIGRSTGLALTFKF